MRKQVLILFTIILLMSFYTSPTFAESQINVTINAQPLIFEDVQPTIIEGRTVVPLRGVFEALGATVDWDNDTKTVTVIKGTTTIILQVGSRLSSINGEVVNMEVAGILLKGRTMVPLRFIAENIDTDVSWISETRTIAIINKDGDMTNIWNDSIRYCEINKLYEDQSGLAVVVSSIKKINNNSYDEYEIAYILKNNSKDKILNENVFRMWMSNLEFLDQYGFFDNLYPGDSVEKTYVFKVLKTQEPKIIELGGDFFRNVPETDTLRWLIEN